MLLRNFHMVVPGNRSVISPLNFTVNPRTPLDMKFSSPVITKWHGGGGGGIGLGIVAELEKSGIGINQNPVYYSNSGLNRPDPVLSAHRFHEINNLSEEYTCVTSRHGSKTKVYYNDNEFEFRLNRSVETVEELLAEKKRESSEFLSLCCLCKKKLQGKDIYMYKGEKGFCSKECRSVKIMDDDVSVNLQYKPEYFAGEQESFAGIFII
ncbi:unnamed protein product [Cochlearia groenlandica]